MEDIDRENEHAKIKGKLIEEAKDNAEENDGRTALHVAAGKNYLVMQFIMYKQLDMVDHTDRHTMIYKYDRLICTYITKTDRRITDTFISLLSHLLYAYISHIFS